MDMLKLNIIEISEVRQEIDIIIGQEKQSN